MKYLINVNYLREIIKGKIHSSSTQMQSFVMAKDVGSKRIDK